MSGQILPMKAVRKPNPTHQVTQTATGAMFLKVAGLPNKPAATNNVSIRTASNCRPATTKSGTVPRRIVSSRACMGSSLCRQNSARITNVMTTAAPEAARK